MATSRRKGLISGTVNAPDTRRPQPSQSVRELGEAPNRNSRLLERRYPLGDDLLAILTLAHDHVLPHQEDDRIVRVHVTNAEGERGGRHPDHPDVCRGDAAEHGSQEAELRAAPHRGRWLTQGVSSRASGAWCRNAPPSSRWRVRRSSIILSALNIRRPRFPYQISKVAPRPTEGATKSPGSASREGILCFLPRDPR